MTLLVPSAGRADVAVPPGVAHLEPWVRAGVLDRPEVQVADALERRAGPLAHQVTLAAALAVRAAQAGHVLVDLDEIAVRVIVDAHGDDEQAVDELDWPEPTAWATTLAASDLVREVDGPAELDAVLAGEDPSEPDSWTRPLVLDGHRLHLQRQWRAEQSVAADLLRRASRPSTDTALRRAAEGHLDALLPAEQAGAQRDAATAALDHHLAVIGGGPGTGKTRTVARLLAVLLLAAADAGEEVTVALAAPTGKAAARMTEAVRAEVADLDLPATVAADLGATEATTIHRLLGSMGRRGYRHDADRPLPHDVVVIDEVSMVSLPLMAALVDAVRPDARLVLVGDPDQLTSVEAGAVLADVLGPLAAHGPGDREVVGPLAAGSVVLERSHRFAAGSAVADLAAAVRGGQADEVLAALDGDGPVRWIPEPDEAVLDAVGGAAGRALAAGRDGDAEAGLEALGDLQVLCALRHGPHGAGGWNRRVEELAAARVAEAGRGHDWQPGRPVMITRNDPLNRVFNGDVGLVVAGSDGDARVQVALPTPDGGVRLIDPSRLAHLEALWALTIHKSQGSEWRHVVVVLPPAPSPVLTRQLLYTAVTRAREEVTVVGPEESVRAAVARPVQRATGLARLLWR